MYTSLSLDHEILRDAVSEKTLTVLDKREMVHYVMTEHQASNDAGAGLSVSVEACYIIARTRHGTCLWSRRYKNLHTGIRPEVLDLCSTSYATQAYCGMKTGLPDLSVVKTQLLAQR